MSSVLLLEVLGKLPDVQRILSKHEPIGNSFQDLFLLSIVILTFCMGVAVMFLTAYIQTDWQRGGKWTKKMTWLTVLDVAMFIWVLLTFPVMGIVVGIIMVFLVSLGILTNDFV